MKRNVNKYEKVDTLPYNALTVSEYAKQNNYSQSYIYKMLERNIASYKIVVFQTINFVIPLTND